LTQVIPARASSFPGGIPVSSRAMHPTTNIAIRAARAGGRVLLKYFGRADTLTIQKKGRNDFVTEVDRGAEQAIIAVLKKAYPDYGILAEESGEQEGNDYQWVIDPLDGTTNFLHGFPQFSVSIALKHKDVLQTGVVYDPLRDEIFTAHKGNGAFLNERRLRVSKRRGLDGALIGTGFPYRDQRHIDAYLSMFKDLVLETAGLRRPGSAALDFAWVAAGRIDGFWELGLSQWDFAAGALLVQEAGGVVSDIAGGKRHLKTGNVVAGGLRVHQALLGAIKPHLSDPLKNG